MAGETQQKRPPLVDQASLFGALLLGLVELEERAAETESALDQVYGALRPGSDRNGSRRARALSILLGEARLEAVRDALVRHGLPATRIELRRPRASSGVGDGGGRVLVEQR